MTGLVDLHSHSDQSDGSLTPEQLVDHAVDTGIAVLALTDHDTTAGHKRFNDRARERGLVPVCGVEVSCTWNPGHCHLLGLGVRDDSPALESALVEIRGGRDRRNQKIVDRLCSLGYTVTLDEIASKAGGDVVGRPHMATVLFEKGLVPTYQVAFDQLLGKGGAAYVDRFRLDPEQAVELVVKAGGKPVLAHPTFLRLDDTGLTAFARRLIPHGLWGLEASYTGYDDPRVATLQELADDLGLVSTMGSDFHGDPKPYAIMGHRAPGVPLPGPCPAELLPG